MPPPAIRVRNLSKKYQIGAREAQPTSFREALTGALASPFRRFQSLRGTSSQAETFWALKDVSFDIEEGEVVGVIGRNGAGKSTLLKILSQITEPTSGEVELHGRVGSLLEVGTGFHPELSGRENIYLNGAILGMKREEITKRFDEIVAFAEVEQFLDTPVKRYSSGMYVRLAFAVAAHLEPEILIVDEVLAVGDAAFQKKCLGKMEGVARLGRTVLVVSHTMALIQQLCKNALFLRSGQLVECGEASEIVTQYLVDGMTDADSPIVETANHASRWPRMKAIINQVSLHAANGMAKSDFNQGEPVLLRLTYDARRFGVNLTGIGFNLKSINGIRVGGFNSYMATKPPHRIPASGVIEFEIKKPWLTPGRYNLSVSVASHQGVLEDMVEGVVSFDVHSCDVYQTGYLLTRDDGLVAMDCGYRVL